jgi:hypothetical protein
LLSDIQNDTLQPYLNLGEVVARGNQGLIFDLAGAPISPVPLPGALPLFGAALAGMAGLRLRKKAENQAA